MICKLTESGRDPLAPPVIVIGIYDRAPLQKWTNPAEWYPPWQLPWNKGAGVTRASVLRRRGVLAFKTQVTGCFAGMQMELACMEQMIYIKIHYRQKVWNIFQFVWLLLFCEQLHQNCDFLFEIGHVQPLCRDVLTIIRSSMADQSFDPGVPQGDVL